MALGCELIAASTSVIWPAAEKPGTSAMHETTRPEVEQNTRSFVGEYFAF
jgi:hypothetical protein